MLCGKSYAMLVVIYIGRILKIPFLLCHSNRYNSVVASAGIVERTSITLAFGAKLAFRVRVLRCVFCRGNRLRVFFRLGKIDRYVYISVSARHSPLNVLLNTVRSYVISIFGKAVVPICRFLRASGIKLLELAYNLARAGRKNAHNLRIKKVALGNVIVYNSLFRGVIANRRQNILQRLFLRNLCILICIEAQKAEHGVYRIVSVAFGNKTASYRAINKLFDFTANHFLKSFLKN